MSVGLLAGEGRLSDDNLGELLVGVIRLLKGAVAAEFIPQGSTHSPVVMADLTHAKAAAALHTIASERLTQAGPWGKAAAETWTAWVEPAPHADPAGRADGAGADDVAGVLALAFRERETFEDDEIDAIKLFARLCGTVTRPRDPTSEIAQQRRLDDLVSTISERLMSTTAPTLQSALDWAVERLCRFLGADFAFLRRNDHLHGSSILMAFYPPRDLPLEEDPLGIVPFDSDPIFAATKDLRVPLVMRNSLESDERYLQRVRDAGVSDQFTGAAVPLMHGDTTEGILAFIYMTTYTWSEQEVNALRAVAALLVQLLHRIDAEERLRHNALTDDLTGLPNRRALLDEVSSRQQGGSGSIALLFIDLDRFKVMNDQLGHSAGDTVLQVVADRIRTSLRPTDFAARLGGDEFVVLLQDSEDGLGAVSAASRLLDLISLPIDVRGQRVAHTGSVGIALSDGPTVGAEDLLGRADMALYEAKSQGRSRVVVFDHELEKRVAQRASIELLLRQALSENALRLHYQPEFDLRTGELLAVEALVRWHRPDKGLIQAAQFVPIAEETHLITDIDRWVLEEASSQMAAWRRSFPGSEFMVRVNMSAAQLSVGGVVRTVADCLRRSGLPSRQLCLEITEEAVIADVEQAVRLLRDIRSMGVKLAIDDFGTGQSSMSQLKNLPVDVLKIDRVFVDGISTDPTDQAIVEAIVRLAQAFGLEVVGEGVETMADLETLVRLGCGRAQGYLLARPMPPEDIEPLIARGGIDLTTLRQPQADAPIGLRTLSPR
jgi:diguanylate cyclase (GGDEF)-like protein